MPLSPIQAKVVTDQIAWVRKMLAGIGSLPRDSLASFTADPRTPAAAESYLRRGLEALLDLGRHILAKGFGRAVTEYRDVARQLEKAGLLDSPEAALLARMAGYRNRLVHFYHEVSSGRTLRSLYPGPVRYRAGPAGTGTMAAGPSRAPGPCLVARRFTQPTTGGAYRAILNHS